MATESSPIIWHLSIRTGKQTRRCFAWWLLAVSPSSRDTRVMELLCHLFHWPSFASGSPEETMGIPLSSVCQLSLHTCQWPQQDLNLTLLCAEPFSIQRNGWHTISLSGMWLQLPVMTTWRSFTLLSHLMFGFYQKKLVNKSCWFY
jgi:hypothetical protein